MQQVCDEVIRSASDGDAGAFEEIYRAYADYVFNLALRMMRRREDAEEVTQEVFLMVHRSLKNFRGQSSLKTWIYRIAVNTTLNHLKRTKAVRTQTVEYDEEAHAYPGKDEAVSRDTKEYNERVIDALLAELTPDQRACILLRNMDGLTYEEIAQALKIDINAVRSRIKRARLKLMAVKKEVMAYEM
jgi:RNA polymerase sigma-70 factor, ECF subfamily